MLFGAGVCGEERRLAGRPATVAMSMRAPTTESKCTRMGGVKTILHAVHGQQAAIGGIGDAKGSLASY